MEHMVEMTPPAVAPVIVEEEVVEIPAKPVPTTPAKCPSFNPKGILACELDVHSDAVLHRFSWLTINGEQIEYW
jgi:uncharacterized membrane protein